MDYRERISQILGDRNDKRIVVLLAPIHWVHENTIEIKLGGEILALTTPATKWELTADGSALLQMGEADVKLLGLEGLVIDEDRIAKVRELQKEAFSLKHRPQDSGEKIGGFRI